MYLLPGKVTTISKAAVSNRAENDDKLSALHDPVEWNYSHLVDPELVKESGSFTTLAVRINNRDDVANEASDRILRDWATHMRDGQEQRSLNSHSARGNLCSFTFIDSPADRLDVVTYWTDMGLLHDDHTESIDELQAFSEHEAFSAAIDFHRAAHDGDRKRALAMKRIAAHSMLEGLKIDRTLCTVMIDKYREDWVDVAEKPRPEDGFQSLVAYMDYRNLNVGMSALWHMISFSLGWAPSEEQHQFITHVMEPIEEGICLTNDFWSWEREAFDSATNGNRMNNAVDIAMRIYKLDEAAAKDWLKERMIGLECEYVQRKLELYTRNPDLCPQLRKWIDHAGHMMAGTHYWASNAPRHHAFKEYRAKADQQVNKAIVTPLVRSVSSSSDESIGSSPPSSCGSDIQIMQQPPKCAPTKASPFDLMAQSVLMAPVSYINSLPSKGVRGMMIEAFNLWLNVPLSSMVIIEKIIADLHNASLIADDIEDGSQLRRGQLATHCIFGIPQAINSSNFMFVLVVQEAMKLSHPNAVGLVCDALVSMYQGQAMDLYWAFHRTVPSMDEYISMVDGKTGGLFNMLLRLAQEESDTVQSVHLKPLVLLLGRFFQIRDDYQNLCSEEYAQQKGSCEDLDEGKASYPLTLLAARRPDLMDEIRGIFRQHPDGLPTHAKQRIVASLKSSGAMSDTLSFLQSLESEIEEVISLAEKDFGEYNPLLRLLVARLSVQV